MSELVVLVRPPGNLTATRAFAADELDQAHAYAAEHSARVEQLAE
ncbi:MAG: hypothetical protein WBF94_06675 [Gordonia sp. (in: high G+C Gram-positive bacteria)]